MSQSSFSPKDLIDYVFGSNDVRNEMMIKIMRVLDAKMDAQMVHWRKMYDEHGEAKFMNAVASEFARQDPDAIRGVCLSLLMRQVRMTKIDDENSDSSGTGNTPDITAHE